MEPLSRYDAILDLDTQTFREPFIYDTETWDWDLKLWLGDGCRVYSELRKKLGW